MLPRTPAPLRSSLRLLMALVIALTGVATAPGAGAAPAQGPAAQAAAPRIAIENLDKVPYNDRLVFNRIANNANLPNHRYVTLRIKNVGNAELQVGPLAISGPHASEFQADKVEDRGGFRIAPGAARDVVMEFDRNTGDLQKGIRSAILTLNTNDPVTPATRVELSGFNMIRTQDVNEPDLQQIIDTFGYTTNAVNPGEGQELNSGRDSSGICFEALGDEVISPTGRWSRADTTKGIYVRQLAAFSGSGTSSVRIGGEIARHDDVNYHSFLPLGTDNKGVVGPVQMLLGVDANGRPTSGFTNFAVGVKGESSVNCTEEPKKLTGVRFWVARDRQGAVIPNTYIVGGDILGSSFTNYDYQDNVYLITNIKPASGSDSYNTPAAEVGSPNLVLEFDRDSYPGTLTDNDGQRTGFSETQRNKDDITDPLNGPSSSYDKSKLNLNTAGQGTLTVRTTAGTNAGAINTQVNALCLPFDARDGRFVVSTRLVGPLNGLSSAEQQAGLLFGPSQGSFIKLTAGTQVGDQSAGKPWIQLVQEINSVATQVGPLVPIPGPAAVNTLDLQLTADPASGEIEAAYRINGGALVALPDLVTLTGPSKGRFFDLRTRGCVVASSRNAAAFDAVFDRFAITEAPPAQGLPTVDAGPDLLVPTGASVALQGSATDADGAPLTGSWQQVGGTPQVALGGSGNSRSFTAPASYSVLTFAFSASDAQNRSASDTVTVTVGEPPISGLNIAANTPVALGSEVRLVASVAAGATPISYRWNFGDGSAEVVGGPLVRHTYAALGTYTVTVTASNALGSATSSLPVVVQTPVPDFAFRYDTGSTRDVTTSNLLWKSDVGLYEPRSTAEKRGDGIPPIANTTDDILYQTYRGRTDTGTITYNFKLNEQLKLPAGTLVRANLRLHFAELYWGGTTPDSGPGGAGRRTFNIIVEGETVINNFDIYAVAGGAERAVILPINAIDVTDGQLTLALQATKDNAAISAIEVLRTPDPELENVAPVISAGANQTVTAGTPVTLSATGSDPEGEAISFVWEQDQSGTPSVTLAGSGASRSFTPSAPGLYSFTVSATDSGGQTGSDTVLIFVEPASEPENRTPTANAGADQTVLAGSEVTLTGSASDPDGDQLTLSWAQTGGPQVTLGGSGASRSFTPAAAGSYTFAFTATDGGGLSATDSVTITVTVPENQAPTANAGADQSVTVNTAVTLSGSASDPDGDQLTLSWSQVENGAPTVTLGGSGASRAFTPTVAGAYIFAFTATDGGGLSATDSVAINVTQDPPPPNRAPSANAGADQTVRVGSQVTLAGTGSDPENNPLTFSWVQTSGPDVTLGGGGASRSFTPAAAGSYVFTLVVTDNGGLSGADSVMITAVANVAPVANAGPDQRVEAGAAVTLSGVASSDPQGDPISYSWQQIGGPAVTLQGANTVQPSFTAPGQAATLTFRLTVTDDGQLTGVDTVAVTVVNNQAPTARASAPQSARGGAAVTLDGSASSDPESTALTYRWQQIGGPAVTLQGATTARASFTAPGQAATLTFRLTVTDAAGLSASAEVQVRILVDPAPAGNKIYLPLLSR